uniref:Uncharacterized protein n=1 Tax=Hyaloperonospora arabidopsidis (strain Emoy2) TaxID=559515 RepID=M4C5J9_HYAAE
MVRIWTKRLTSAARCCPRWFYCTCVSHSCHVFGPSCRETLFGGCDAPYCREKVETSVSVCCGNFQYTNDLVLVTKKPNRKIIPQYGDKRSCGWQSEMRRLLLQPGLNVARRGASGGAEMRIGIVALLSVLSLSLARAYVLTCFFIGIDMLAALQMSRHI